MHRLSGAVVVLALAHVASACTQSDVRFVAKTWPVDHTAVVVVTDELDAPITAARVVPPGAPLVFELDTARRVRLHVATWGPGVRSSDGRSIEECGVVLGGDGAALPEAETHWSSALVALASTNDVVLERDAEPILLDLRFERCAAPDPCAGLRAMRVDVPAGIRPRAITAIGPDAAILGGDRPDEPLIVRVDGRTAVLAPDEPRLTTIFEDLAWDGESSVVGVAEDGAVLRLDLAGRLIEAPRRFGPELERLAFGAGVQLAIDHDGTLWRFTRTATAIEQVVGAPTALRSAAAVRPDRVFARAPDHIHLFDGATWAVEHESPIIENISTLGADDDVAVVAGELENVRVRDPESRRWEHLPERPFDEGLRIRAVAGAGGGRFVAVAELGRIALWTGEVWCRAEHVVDEALAKVAVSTDRRVAWAIGEGRVAADGSTTLVRIELP